MFLNSLWCCLVVCVSFKPSKFMCSMRSWVQYRKQNENVDWIPRGSQNLWELCQYAGEHGLGCGREKGVVGYREGIGVGWGMETYCWAVMNRIQSTVSVLFPGQTKWKTSPTIDLCGRGPRLCFCPFCSRRCRLKSIHLQYQFKKRPGLLDRLGLDSANSHSLESKRQESRYRLSWLL